MNKSSGSVVFLQLALALMFITLGIAGITHYNSGGVEFLRGLNKAFGRTNDIIPIIMAVIELVAGVLLLINLFGIIPGKTASVLLLIVFIYWGFTIVMNFFVDNLFEPDLLVWLGNISPQLVVLSALWIVFRRNS
ncbi:MAG: hypothetical protein JEY99_19665 [Spirochaetales bacterium]|nr:hypothetical protein [Spirochaetales bacterium]